MRLLLALFVLITLFSPCHATLGLSRVHEALRSHHGHGHEHQQHGHTKHVIHHKHRMEQEQQLEQEQEQEQEHAIQHKHKHQHQITHHGREKGKIKHAMKLAHHHKLHVQQQQSQQQEQLQEVDLTQETEQQQQQTQRNKHKLSHKHQQLHKIKAHMSTTKCTKPPVPIPKFDKKKKYNILIEGDIEAKTPEEQQERRALVSKKIHSWNHMLASDVEYKLQHVQMLMITPNGAIPADEAKDHVTELVKVFCLPVSVTEA